MDNYPVLGSISLVLHKIDPIMWKQMYSDFCRRYFWSTHSSARTTYIKTPDFPILQQQISWSFTTMKDLYAKILATIICLQTIFVTIFPLGAGKLILINYTIEILYNGYEKYLHHYPHFLTKRVFLPSFIFHFIVSNLCSYRKVLNDRKLDIHEFN